MAPREAIVAVLRRADRVLVIRRGPDSARAGYWAPLSGKLEPGESQEEALVREVKEEVGLTVSPLSKVWQSDAADGTFRLHWWTATETGNGTIVPDPGEVSEVRWVTPTEFLTMTPAFDADREFFEHVLPGL
ncbi:NUDIX hydrolase [Streptomyces sp. NBC_00988]|uniref:NUDIX domain-containing protein n=1 Tax=Streptomyces sp. NBC_00988 TaxID=2903704 RepID=UPI00386596B8|nr:NUDIX hydrolase [Streptomyces sp. NBC_00988]